MCATTSTPSAGSISTPQGLLILTNDGDLAARLTHPRHGIARVYEARVLGVPDAHDITRLAKGIVIDGRRTQPAVVKVLHARGDDATLEITVREGRNRQVRNMCEAIGHPVSSLRRVAIGPIRDPQLRLGRWRDLDEAEVARLQARPPQTPRPDSTKPATDERRAYEETRPAQRRNRRDALNESPEFSCACSACV